MSRAQIRLGVVAGVVAALFVVAGTVGAADKGVTIAGFAFKPDTITVKAGDTVTWTNNDGTTHTATGSGFDTGNISSGTSASVTFNTAGSFVYHCSIHASMTGTVVVEAAAGGGATTPPTDTLPVARVAGGDDTRGIGGPGALGLMALIGLIGAVAVTRRLSTRRAG